MHAASALLAAALVAVPVALPSLALAEARVIETLDVQVVPPDGRFDAVPRVIAPAGPTLALALSGGGARGMAHVGVLDALEEDGLDAAAIAGTSVGALIGALRVTGHPPAEIGDLLSRRDWGEILSSFGAGLAAGRPRQWDGRSRPLVSLRFGGHQTLRTPGLLDGEDFRLELTRLLLGAEVLSGQDFDHLRRPFRPVCADLVSGLPLVPSRGSLSAAVRGSAAVPGLMPPVPFGAALLSDGGLVENIPVRTARALAPSALVVAVDVSEPIAAAGTLSGTLAVIDRAVSVMTAAEARESLGAADLIVRPAVTVFSRADLSPQAVLAMREAGRAAYAAVRDELWTALEARAEAGGRIAFGAVEVTGTARVTSDELARRLGGAQGSVTRWRAAAELARLLDRGPFASGRCEVVEDAGQRILRYTLTDSATLRGVELTGLAQPPKDLTGLQPEGEPAYSHELARSIASSARQALLAEGRALARVALSSWDDSTGRLTLELRETTVDGIDVVVEGGVELARTTRFIQHAPDRAFSIDAVTNDMARIEASRTVDSWELRVAPAEAEPADATEPGVVRLQLGARGDDAYEASGGASYRSDFGWGAFGRIGRLNLSGRGDVADLTLLGSEERVELAARYHAERAVLLERLGAEVAVRRFELDTPVVDLQLDQAGPSERASGARAEAAFLLRPAPRVRLRLGAFHERLRFEATPTLPAERQARTSLEFSAEWNHVDPLTVGGRGSVVELRGERSVGGDDRWRGHLGGTWAGGGGASSRHLLLARFGLSLSGGAGRRPLWHDPGGYLDLRGFIPHAAAAPQVVTAGLGWRWRWRDLGPLRFFLDAGLDAVRLGTDPTDLRDANTVVGGALAVTAHADITGPITLGIGRNDAGGGTVFLTAGWVLPR